MADRLELELLNERFAANVVGAVGDKGVNAYLGIVVTDIEPGRCVAGFDVTDELLTPFGNMHGGCLSVLVDHVLGVILYPVMPPGHWAATTEFKINLLAPVSGGRCTATAEILSMTRRLAVVRTEVHNDDRLVALAQGTCTIVAPKNG
jgi:1,4-dihydroxy-2-naphthoyl-CoA hydrolase